jgi:hypothetical protein
MRARNGAGHLNVDPWGINFYISCPCSPRPGSKVVMLGTANPASAGSIPAPASTLIDAIFDGRRADAGATPADWL